jgi:hypothetical protein
VINWAAVEPWSGKVTFTGPDPFQPATTETYMPFCERPEGTIHSPRQVGLDRGERRTLDVRGDCARRR